MCLHINANEKHALSSLMFFYMYIRTMSSTFIACVIKYFPIIVNSSWKWNTILVLLYFLKIDLTGKYYRRLCFWMHNNTKRRNLLSYSFLKADLRKYDTLVRIKWMICSSLWSVTLSFSPLFEFATTTSHSSPPSSSLIKNALGTLLCTANFIAENKVSFFNGRSS